MNEYSENEIQSVTTREHPMFFLSILTTIQAQVFARVRTCTYVWIRFPSYSAVKRSIIRIILLYFYFDLLTTEHRVQSGIDRLRIVLSRVFFHNFVMKKYF